MSLWIAISLELPTIPKGSSFVWVSLFVSFGFCSMNVSPKILSFFIKKFFLSKGLARELDFEIWVYSSITPSWKVYFGLEIISFDLLLLLRSILDLIISSGSTWISIELLSVIFLSGLKEKAFASWDGNSYYIYFSFTTIYFFVWFLAS